uniref:Uncharacterized protein n=1 Tax=Marmota marmota marmota TaxID=9994 RepID=A0A8C5ZMP6_MARMA
MGHQAIIHTTGVGKVEMAFPAMNMMQRFLGICLRGLKATSQPFTRILSPAHWYPVPACPSNGLGIVSVPDQGLGHLDPCSLF